MPAVSYGVPRDSSKPMVTSRLLFVASRGDEDTNCTEVRRLVLRDRVVEAGGEPSPGLGTGDLLRKRYPAATMSGLPVGSRPCLGQTDPVQTPACAASHG